MRARNIAILFLSHLTNQTTFNEHENISSAIKDMADVYLLLHLADRFAGTWPNNTNVTPFFHRDLATLGYPDVAVPIVPGNTHFPLMYFFSRYPDYEYYWLVEYDVRFSGNWKTFFKAFHQNDAHLLTCHIRSFSEEPNWYWWRHLSHHKVIVPLEQRLRSFNPIYRASNLALKYLHESHRDQWRGHFEVLIPTLLYHGGFKLEDIGGDGRFTPSGNKNGFYTEGSNGTFRWRPAFNQVGIEPNKLYHPVKSAH
jgi:hypothetical protein